MLNRNATEIYPWLILAFIQLIATAWICDDAAIILRSVLNLLHGFGPNFNIDERVQAYTSPLWFLLISVTSLLIHNVFLTTFLLSIGCALLALWFFGRLIIFPESGIFAMALLLLSRSYVDFSTSGLENPLSHLLLILGLIRSFKTLRSTQKNPQIPLLIFSLLFLTRPDLVLLILPFCVLLLFSMVRSVRDENHRSIFFLKLIKILFVASVPIFVWTLFSTLYYGFPLPNTVYAKLFTDIDFKARLIQGVHYLMISFAWDPVTLLTIFLSFLFYKQRRVSSDQSIRKLKIDCLEIYSIRALFLGQGLYFLYLMTIGGDFMAGRFLTAPLLISAVVIARNPLSCAQIKNLIVASLLLTAIGMNTALNTSNWQYTYGVADERGFYFFRTGLVNAWHNHVFAIPQWKDEKTSILTACGGIGLVGIALGPGLHIIDVCGLADPLLSHLPVANRVHWRIGHFIRSLPIGYVQSVESHRNLLIDPLTQQYYSAIMDVTRGHLFSKTRLRNILRLNLGLIARPNHVSSLNNSLNG
jgi:arabinofuranosyltransferase